MGNCGTREESAAVTSAVVSTLRADSVKTHRVPLIQHQQQQYEQKKEQDQPSPHELIRKTTSVRRQSLSSFSDLSNPSTPKGVEDLRQNSGSNLLVFTLYELETITKSFRKDYVLGEGGFGTVYKGFIDESVRRGLKSAPVAVKVLNKNGLQGHREWLAEVIFLGQLRHPHLVKLIGYCCEDDHRLLVYEFMFRGSLENHLFRKVSVPLPWSTRMMIALGAAKGLAFLHGAEKPVIYRDFKTSNILLDSVGIGTGSGGVLFYICEIYFLLYMFELVAYREFMLEDYTAKLSDFGLAKDGPQGDETHVSTRVMGTYGYAAPEYVMTGHLTARSDVYSFGVVLLELLTGRRSVDKTKTTREHNLVEWARPLLNDKRKLLQIIDPRLEGQYSMKGAQKACSLAYHCLSQNPKARPLMSDVVETLEPLQNRKETISASFTYTLNSGVAAYQIHSSGNGCHTYQDSSPTNRNGPTVCRVR